MIQLLVKDLLWLRMADRDGIADALSSERLPASAAASADASESRGQDNVHYGLPNPLNRWKEGA